MVGDQLTHRGAGCQQECASCFRRARARQRFRLVFDVGEAACNLSEPLFNSNWNRLSRELRAGICAGNPRAQGGTACSWHAKNAFLKQRWAKWKNEKHPVGARETVDLLDPAGLGWEPSSNCRGNPFWKLLQPLLYQLNFTGDFSNPRLPAPS